MLQIKNICRFKILTCVGCGDIVLQGFGHLVPSCEPSKVMGVLYESCIFPVHNGQRAENTRITVSHLINSCTYVLSILIMYNLVI